MIAIGDSTMVLFMSLSLVTFLYTFRFRSKDVRTAFALIAFGIMYIGIFISMLVKFLFA